MIIVVLLGAPGAGKGTQAAVLADRLEIPHIATGDLFRRAIREETPVGLEARSYMNAGQLVPDEVTIRMLEERLRQPDAEDGAILDGFPRTAVQAASLDEFLAAHDAAVNAALLIDVPAEDLVERLSGRRVCEANGHPFHVTLHPPAVAGRCDVDGSPLIQRADDTPDTIRARLSGTLDDLSDVEAHYRRTSALRIVDGRHAIRDVSAGLLAALGYGDAAPTGLA